MDNDRVTPRTPDPGSGLAGLRDARRPGRQPHHRHPRHGHFRLQPTLPPSAHIGAAGPAQPDRCHARDARAVIRVRLADDENLIRTALASLLAIQDDLQVVAQAASGEEALAMAPGTARTSPCWTCRCPAWTGSPSPDSWSPSCPPAGASSTRN